MKRSANTRQIQIVAFLFMSALSSVCPAHAERVGFRFEGALLGGSTGVYTLFDISVPRNSPVAGTFSYDATTEGVATDIGVRAFHQDVFGGFTLDINNGAIMLTASDYVVTVANDFQRTTEDVDIQSVDFDSRFAPTPVPMEVHGNPWSGSTAFIKIEQSWPSQTFVDPDEPKLTGDRPLTPDAGITAFVGSSPIPRFFSISAISAISSVPGDYNVNGTIDGYDYAEWRLAFGESGGAFQYADGNANGVVDAADYTVWRDAMGPGTAIDSRHATAPEPSGLALASVVFFVALAYSPRTRFRVVAQSNQTEVGFIAG